ASRVEYRVEKAGIIHMSIGKVSFPTEQLVSNFTTLLNALLRARPQAAKGRYLRGITVSATMGPGFPIDTQVATAISEKIVAGGFLAGKGVSHIPTEEKEQAIQELADLVSRSKGAILTDYRGFTVSEITELRKRLRAQGAVYHVVKNTLFKRAVQDGEGLSPYLEGPTAIAFALQDPVGPAKAILDFIREKRKGVVKAGFIEGAVYTEP